MARDAVDAAGGAPGTRDGVNQRDSTSPSVFAAAHGRVRQVEVEPGGLGGQALPDGALVVGGRATRASHRSLTSLGALSPRFPSSAR